VGGAGCVVDGSEGGSVGGAEGFGVVWVGGNWEDEFGGEAVGGLRGFGVGGEFGGGVRVWAGDLCSGVGGDEF